MSELSKDDTNVHTEQTDHFPCPSCGANMVFDPETQKLVCPYCGSQEDVVKDKNDIKENDFFTAEDNASRDWGTKNRVIHCQSCGSDTILGEDMVAELCPFCGSSYIVKNDSSSGIAPESLVPFTITKKKAIGTFSDWIKHKWFAPNKLKKDYHLQSISGIYTPYWTYDSDTFSTYIGEAGQYYYVTETDWVTENGQRKAVTRTVRKIRWYPVRGDYSKFFDDVLINASKNISQHLINKLGGFNLKELVRYNPEFLSGFLAEKYSIGLKDGWSNAQKIIDGKIYSGIVCQINADEVRNIRVNTDYTNIKFKHLLLPIWLSAYKYNNKTYRFIINGQTGKVSGESPVSPWKVALLISVIAIIFVIVYMLTQK